MGFNTQGKPNKYEPAFEDTNVITFGKFKGTPLQDIPASYLAWLWNDNLKGFANSVVNEIDQQYIKDRIMLANYIYNSRNAINQELGKEEIQ